MNGRKEEIYETWAFLFYRLTFITVNMVFLSPFSLSHNFFVFLHITKRVNKGSKWAWWNNNSKEKSIITWKHTALLKINGNQNTKEKLAISADGYYECYAVAFSLLFTTNCFSSFNFLYIFQNLAYIGKEEIISKKVVQL